MTTDLVVAPAGVLQLDEHEAYIRRVCGEIERQWYGANLEVFVEKRLGERIVMRLSGNNLLDAASRQTELGFDGDDGEEIAENQRANNVDAFEVEHEESSPRILFTMRAVF